MQIPSNSEENLSDHLLRYVIAVCYPKMQRRLNHSTLSQPYINSLKKVTEISFHEPPQEPLSQKEIANDQQFLEFVHQVATADHQFSSSFPNTAHQADLFSKGQPFQLYSRDTYKEFHNLLLEFLLHFQDSLNNLADARGPSTTHPAEGSSSFKSYLDAVLLNGYVLQKLSKGSALRTHLKAITSLLQEHRRTDIPTSMPIPKSEKEGEQDGECGNHNENDEELQAVQPFVTTEEGVVVPLWKSYEDWLRLLVVHFDAVDILAGHFSRPDLQQETISLKILVAPAVDSALLPWKKLLTTASHFPTKSSQDPSITNNDILKFIEDVISANPQQSLGYAKGVRTIWQKRDSSKQLTISKFKHEVNYAIKKLSTSKLPGWSECADKLTTMLSTWTGNSDNSLLVVDITNMIDSLYDSANLFVYFDNITNKPAFYGTLHCEACLASLFDHRTEGIDSKMEAISAQMKVCDAFPTCLSSDPYFL
jgi:hypothetical protein